MAIISIPNSIGGVSIPGNIINGPLSALFGNKYDITNLKYPRDLESATKGHIVKIAINEVQPTGYQEGKEYNLNSVGSGIVNSVTSFLSNGKKDDGSTKFNLSLEPSKKKLAATISLYMPDTVTFTYDATWSETSMVDVAKKTLENIGGSAGKAIASTVESNATKLALKSQGIAINPNQQLLFEGLSLKTYQLAFTFTPYSRQEAEAVKQIVKLFRYHAAPQITTTGAGMFFVPPSTFDLDFLFNGQKNPYVTKVTESVIESIDVNYSPNGWAAHDNGAPVQTTLTINFKEIELVDKDKIQAGY